MDECRNGLIFFCLLSAGPTLPGKYQEALGGRRPSMGSSSRGRRLLGSFDAELTPVTDGAHRVQNGIQSEITLFRRSAYFLIQTGVQY